MRVATPGARQQLPEVDAGRSAIFDLDRTLSAGSSMVDLARVLAADGVISRSLLARHALSRELFARRGTGDGRVQRLRLTAMAAVTGCSHEALAHAARVAGEAVAARAFPAARWLLDQHLSAGDFCVVVSAAPQELVEAVVARLGAHRAVGTRGQVEDGRFTGELDGGFCYGAGKIARLRAEVGPVDLGAAAAYADSASDLPLLRACARPVAVNPDRRLRRAAAAAGWPVLRFG
jgi:HAD superfamily hydrolase (TIGR01490 family)